MSRLASPMPSPSLHRRTGSSRLRLAPFLLAWGLVVSPACKKNPQCCDTPDCSGGSSKRVGTDVLQFKGRVPENLLFLSIDTLRKDHLGTYGGPSNNTPFLDRKAREGLVLYDHHQCANWTLAGMACTLAGAYDTDRGHQTRLQGTDQNRPPIPDGTPLLPLWLSDAGYRTAAVSSNSFFSKKWGTNQGFERFGNPPGGGEAAGPKGLTFLRSLLQDANDPWFLHLHFIEPHAPYDPGASFLDGLDDLPQWPTDLSDKDTHYDERGEWPDMVPQEQDLLESHLRVRYAGEVRYLDSLIEDTWKDYDQKCWLDDTLVVVWSDHGEAFWEHGKQTHAYNLTGEENDGVLFFWAKNIVAGTYAEPTSTIDLVPTLLDLYGLPIPPEVTGVPIGTAHADRPLFAGTLGRLGGVQAVMKAGYKMQYHWASSRVRLWNRSADPEETDDLFDADDPWVQELWTDLLPQIARMAELVVRQDPAPTWPDDLPRPE